MFDISNYFKLDIGVDIGSYRTRAYEEGLGVFFDELTFLTYNSQSKTPLAYGLDSKNMIGRVPKGIEVVKPIQSGEIVTNAYFEIYLKNIFENFTQKSKSFKFKSKPRVFIPLPIDHTQSSLANFETSILKAGASEVKFLKKLVVASMGLPNFNSKGRARMIIDIGYQKSEIGVVFNGEIYEGRVISFGGETIDRVLLNKLAEEKRVQSSINNAEIYKEQCLVFQPFLQENEKFKVVGKDTRKGIPVSTEVSFLELREMVIPYLRNDFIKHIKVFFSSLSDNIIGDIYEEGIYLIGGTAKNVSLAKFLSKEIGIKFNIVSEPDRVVVGGLKSILKDPKLIQKSLV